MRINEIREWLVTMGYPLYPIDIVKEISSLQLDNKGLKILPDLKALKNLKHLSINNNNFKELILEHPNLNILSCQLNNLTKIHLKTPNLEKIYTGHNKIQDFYIEGRPKLLHLNSSSIKNFKISDHSHVENFNGAGNNFHIEEHNKALFEKFNIPYTLIEHSSLKDL